MKIRNLVLLCFLRLRSLDSLKTIASITSVPFLIHSAHESNITNRKFKLFHKKQGKNLFNLLCLSPWISCIMVKDSSWDFGSPLVCLLVLVCPTRSHHLNGTGTASFQSLEPCTMCMPTGQCAWLSRATATDLPPTIKNMFVTADLVNYFGVLGSNTYKVRCAHGQL